MNNRRYAGPSARDAMVDRRSAAADTLSILSKSPEEIVNEIVRDLDLDDRYMVGSNGRVSSGYAELSPAERAAASNQIQNELMGRCEKEVYRRVAEEQRATDKQPQRKSSPRRRVRLDRVAAFGMVITLLSSMGYAVGKRVISGVRGNPEIQGLPKDPTSISDTLTPESSENEENGDITYETESMRHDEVSYVIDFMDYYNQSEKEHIMQMLNNGMIDGLGIRIGGSKMDYPFAIKNFVDEEINNELQWYVDNGKVELDHKYGQEIAWAEEFIKKAPITMPYYYTCAVNYEEAEIEAKCIEATYKKMENDLPGYNFKDRMAPITIDIEHCGDEKLAAEGDPIEQSGAKEYRTQSVLHLVDCLKDSGIIDERGVIIYGDLNRMKDQTQINWEELFNELDARNINVVKWGTRAIQETFSNPKEYKDVYDFRDALMNTSTNISYMKSDYDKLGQYIYDVDIQQIHLDQQMKTDSYGEKYDVNITTKNTLDAIVHGYPITHEQGFIEKIENIRMKELKKDLQGENRDPGGYIPAGYDEER